MYAYRNFYTKTNQIIMCYRIFLIRAASACIPDPETSNNHLNTVCFQQPLWNVMNVLPPLAP